MRMKLSLIYNINEIYMIDLNYSLKNLISLNFQNYNLNKKFKQIKFLKNALSRSGEQTQIKNYLKHNKK